MLTSQGSELDWIYLVETVGGFTDISSRIYSKTIQVLYFGPLHYKIHYFERYAPRGGSKRETTGILMWSKVYKLRTQDNREVAVVLMDTQVCKWGHMITYIRVEGFITFLQFFENWHISVNEVGILRFFSQKIGNFVFSAKFLFLKNPENLKKKMWFWKFAKTIQHN